MSTKAIEISIDGIHPDMMEPQENVWQSPEDVQDKKSGNDTAQLTKELKSANGKIRILVKQVGILTDICKNLQFMIDGINEKQSHVEEMAERAFVMLKVLEGNQQKTIKIGLECLSRKNIRIENMTFSIQEMAKGFHVTRMTVDRWRKGNRKNPQRKIRYKYDLEADKPYFIYKELLEDILNNKVPTKKSKDYLLECLSVMASQRNADDRKDELEDLPQEFKDL